MRNIELHTPRLTLRAATTALFDAELAGTRQLSTAVDACVPMDWPPGDYDRDAIAFFRTQVAEGGPSVVPWYSWYALMNPYKGEPTTLVGAGGYFGPPGADRICEIGYSVSTYYRKIGIATELVTALVEHAFASGLVSLVIAHATAENAASCAVLRKCGFREATSEKPEYLRFELASAP